MNDLMNEDDPFSESKPDPHNAKWVSERIEFIH